ncbi:hypothetical protein [Flammeovirga sp. SJP92]|uniref:hypothetical protein n=1 Tax=Flammeovirga sp. SJP92 TaxID=1775430 RepID=UPI00078719AC|nr:hypothetical protein [Flammeovirga sp. SJP92]KXX68773.1 hypothetical protein AVL50_18215 [Flammeovirga sp. SJP92]
MNTSAQTSSRTEIQLTGFIAERYPISMTLSIDNENVAGYYYYEKYKTKILLEGQLKDGQITLNESPDLGSEFTMGFKGRLDEDEFNGNWIDIKKNKTLSSHLDVTSKDEITLSEKIKSIEGNYESEYNSETYVGNLKLKFIADQFYYFTLSTGTSSGCTGHLKGIATFNDSGKGTYSNGKKCEKIEFLPSNTTLKIEETDCNAHGMQCSFNGGYKKTEVTDL